MSRILADMVAWGKQYLRSPIASFFTLAFPVVLLLIFGAVFGNPAQITLQVHAQNLDNDSGHSMALIDAISATGVDLVIVSPSEDLTTFIREQSIPVALEIPEGFHAEVEIAKAAGNPLVHAVITLHGDMSSSAFQAVEGTVSGAVTRLNFELSNATAAVVVETQGLGDGSAQTSDSALGFFLPGIIGIMVLTPIFMVSAIGAEYRTRHYFKLLATTPLRKGEYLLSRTAFIIGLTFISAFLIILVAWLVFGELFVLTPIAIGLIASGAVLFVAIGMAVGSLAKDPEAASAVANIVYFPMMFLTGTFFPLEVMPGFIQTAALFLPLTYFNNGLRDTLVFENVGGALGNLAVVAVIAVIIFVLAAWSLKWRAE
ncbi:MAG: ABC transporter permease [Thermoplasmata archaeon]